MDGVQIQSLGLVEYRTALRLQERFHARVTRSREAEKILLLEHPHVVTVGTRGPETPLLAQSAEDGLPEVHHIRRGGGATYHGPGQLVGYPILDLRRRGRDVHLFLRTLEECLIRTASDVGVSAWRVDKLTGVWTEQGKLASIGVGVKQWVTMHGFALNVSPDLGYFKLIDPCGIPGCPVTSLSALLSRPVSVAEVEPLIRHHLQQLLTVSRPEEKPDEDLFQTADSFEGHC